MKIGFIGLGHMAGSILKAISRHREYDFYVNDHHEDRLAKYKEELGERFAISSYEEILSFCPYVFLGVKPTDMGSLLESIRPYVGSNVLISMAAGYSLKEILEKTRESTKVIRIMPNTPVAVNKGVSFAVYQNVCPIEKKRFLKMMSLTGALYEIKEEDIDTVSVLTGSTPAYLDYFLDALIQFGVSKGFSELEAREYVLKMAEGVIALDKASSKSPIELGKEVCSPGGSTIEGVDLLERNGFREMVKEAAEASYNKTKKMK
ncbi:MAG: pyrroline-5-carboxylate reductase [Bacilli bacterium]|nr:pyrroline-5-carboxylate reductase [Bacilli bacterium]